MVLPPPDRLVADGPHLVGDLLRPEPHRLGPLAEQYRTVRAFTVNRENIDATLAANPILVTALNREIGYDKAAAIAKRCFTERRAVLDVALEETDLSRELLAQLLDPQRLTGLNKE